MDIQTLYQNTIRFAAQKHSEQNQTIPGTNLPYVVHLSNVAMEILVAYQQQPDFDLSFAIQVALLHDVMEDTGTGFEELAAAFSTAIAAGVAALTKNDNLSKEEKMTDSLERIKKQPREVAAVKLADRITNLQAPPAHWTSYKIKDYGKEALTILQLLAGTHAYLEKRMEQKINHYGSY